MEEDKNKIKEVIDFLTNSFGEDNVELYKKLIGDIDLKDIQDYDDFYFKLIYPFESFLDGLIQVEISRVRDIRFIYKNSQFIENHFQKLIEKIEGSACCADKSRTIMRGLVRFYKEDKEIVWNYEQEYTYHLPGKVFVAHDEIINFYNALVNLYYGNPIKYFESYKEILNKIKKEE